MPPRWTAAEIGLALAALLFFAATFYWGVNTR